MIFERTNKIRMGDIYLYLGPECNLLARDLQVELGIRVLPESAKMVAKLLWLKEENEKQIKDIVWAKPGNRDKLNITPMVIKITNQDCPIQVWQYPLSLEGRKGLQTVIKELIKDGTLEPCMSPHNTPILPVKKIG